MKGYRLKRGCDSFVADRSHSMHDEKPGQLFKYTGPKSAPMTTSWLEFLWSSHELNDPTRPTKERHHSRKVTGLPHSNTFSSRMMTGPHWAHVTDWKRHQGRCYDACNIIQHDQYGKSSDPLSHSLVRSMQTSSPLDRLISLKFNWLWVSLWWWSLNLSILQMYKRHLSLNSVHFVKLLNISTFVAIPIFIGLKF